MNGHHYKIDSELLETNLMFDSNSQKQRDQQWKTIDTDNQGYIVIAQFEQWVQRILELQNLWTTGLDQDYIDMYRTLLLDTLKSNQMYRMDENRLNDYIHKDQFCAAISFTRSFFEFYIMFDQVDKNNGGKISLQQFLRGVELLNQWGADITNPRSAFQALDPNGSNNIKFHEFIAYVIQQQVHEK